MLLFELGPPGAAGGFAGNCQTAPKKRQQQIRFMGLKIIFIKHLLKLVDKNLF